MSYSANIPQPTDKLKNSQSDILANFTAIGNIITVDNGVYLLPENALDPDTALNQAAFYSKEQAGRTQLFWRRENDGNVISMTGGSPSPTGVQGYSMLPSGVVMKWGGFSLSGTSATMNFSTFAVGAPDYTNVPLLMLTIRDTTNTAYIAKVHTVTATTFVVTMFTTAGTDPGLSIGLSFLAIGI